MQTKVEGPVAGGGGGEGVGMEDRGKVRGGMWVGGLVDVN